MATEGTFEMLLSRDPPPSLQPRTAFSEAAAQQIKGLAAAGIHQKYVPFLCRPSH